VLIFLRHVGVVSGPEAGSKGGLSTVLAALRPGRVTRRWEKITTSVGLLGKVRLVRLRVLGDWETSTKRAADGEHLYHRWSGLKSLAGAQFCREDQSDSLRWHSCLVAGSVDANRLFCARHPSLRRFRPHHDTGCR
jgi:hypothetical protein